MAGSGQSRVVGRTGVMLTRHEKHRIFRISKSKLCVRGQGSLIGLGFGWGRDGKAVWPFNK